MISDSRSANPPHLRDTRRRAKLPQLAPGQVRPLIQLSDPEETLIIPYHENRIEAVIGEDNQIKRLIIYVKRSTIRKARFWRRLIRR